MFRYLLRTGHIARASTISVRERSLIFSKCNKPAVFRLLSRSGLKPLSTCSARLCEKKDHAVLSNNDAKEQVDKKHETAESLTVAELKVEDAQKDHVVLSDKNENMNADKKDELGESLTVAALNVEDAHKDHVVLSDKNENINADKKDEPAESLTVAAQKVEDTLKDNVVLSDQNENINVDKKDELEETLTVAAQKSEEYNTDHVVLSNHDEKINLDHKDESAESLTVAAQEAEDAKKDNIVLSDHDVTTNLDKQDESTESLTLAAQEAEDKNFDKEILSDHDGKINADEKDNLTESLTVASQKDEDEKFDHVVLSNHNENLILEKKDETIETPKGEVLITAELKEEPVLLKTKDGGSAQEQQQVVVDMEQNVSSPEQAPPQAPKSGKESLLDLLSSMKVQVVSKRKGSKAKQSKAPTPKSQPVTMESTISMFEESMTEAKADGMAEPLTEVESEAMMEVTAEATTEASLQGETLDPQLVSAASAAAATLPNVKEAKSELLKQLRWQESVTMAQSTGNQNNLSALIADMKVRKPSKRQSPRPISSVAFDEDSSRFKRDESLGGITAELGDVRRRILNKGNALGIFSPPTDGARVESAVARPTLWDMDFALKLSESVDHRPQNGLEEMIQWTKEGKMWEYPINNEAGMEEEAKVQFHEHIFLEEHLKDGFPQKGPVRHFMELVVAGLSRNPYLTVQQKTEHISWFRDYFHQKEDILIEAGVHLK